MSGASETDDRPSRSTKDRALLALRTVIRNDGAAYNYSLLDGASACVLAPFLASLVYVLLSAANMAMARYAEEQRENG